MRRGSPGAFRRAPSLRPRPTPLRLRYAQHPSWPNPHAQVTIHRDPWGVPHIIADTEEAGFYGLGYAQAEDQLEFILNMFLAGRGELAAAFGDGTTSGFGGPPTANAIPTDIQSRMWRHVEEAQAGI